MSFSRVFSAQPELLRGELITVEVDVAHNTLYAFSVVGLPDKAVEESRDRVSAALKNSGFASPKSQNQKIIVSLSPADVRKEGAYFDLPIALSYLLATGEMSFDPDKKLFVGELALNGIVRPVRGILPIVKEARARGFEEIFVPIDNALEAGLVDGIRIYPVANLREIIFHLSPSEDSMEKHDIVPQPKTKPMMESPVHFVDFSSIKGQAAGKRALTIAAAGGHNIALFGPPGTGKTLLARAFASLLPPLGEAESLAVTSIHSVAGTLRSTLVQHPPFRAPHHTASYVSIVGGGTTPRPGEVTLAHYGVLFLDEFPEFDKRVIESLRQPLEDHVVSISRAKGTAIFPSDFMLVAAMNPCPCGYLTSKQKRCSCTASSLQKYSRKLSGPIMDRIDMWVAVPEVDYKILGGETADGSARGESARAVKIIQDARTRGLARNGETILNSRIKIEDIDVMTNLAPEARVTLRESAEKLGLSARAYHRVQKLARTIADLEDMEVVSPAHILEALQYRPKV